MEFVYLMTNEHVPELVKFGFSTRHPDERAIELSSPTGVPGRWVVAHYWEVVDGYGVEQEVFKALSTHRIGRQEFFRLTPDDARKKISALIRKVGTNPREEARQRKIAEQKRQELVRADEERNRAQAEQRVARINSLRREIAKVEEEAPALATFRAQRDRREKRVRRLAFILSFVGCSIGAAANVAQTLSGALFLGAIFTAVIYATIVPFVAFSMVADWLLSQFGDEDISFDFGKARKDAEELVLRRHGLKSIDDIK